MCFHLRIHDRNRSKTRADHQREPSKGVWVRSSVIFTQTRPELLWSFFSLFLLTFNLFSKIKPLKLKLPNWEEWLSDCPTLDDLRWFFFHNFDVLMSLKRLKDQGQLLNIRKLYLENDNVGIFERENQRKRPNSLKTNFSFIEDHRWFSITGGFYGDEYRPYDFRC